MLGSLNSSASHHNSNSNNNNNKEEDEDEESSSDIHFHHHQRQPATHMRQLLLTCADLISRSDFSSAHRLLSLLSSNSSPHGDASDRLVHHFSRALSLRLANHNASLTTSSAAFAATSSSSSFNSSNVYDVQSCYLSLNQVTPFIRFSHLTANQAILEAIEVGQQAIHIIDFDIMHGVQWPPLMQALAERSTASLHPPPMLRITGTGHDLSVLRRTGDRLLKFAQSLGLRFQFHPLLTLHDDPALYLPSAVALLPDETLAVNCMLYLHRLLNDDSRRDLVLFLHKIKALNPKIVTMAEREANHNQAALGQRVAEAVEHYGAIFESLEATMPPNSRERESLEEIWLGREIADVVAAEGERRRRERHERFESWDVMMRSSGFQNVPLSPFAVSQAKLLLRLHYPSEGYQLHFLDNSLFLGWLNRPLFSVSSWH